MPCLLEKFYESNNLNGKFNACNFCHNGNAELFCLCVNVSTISERIEKNDYKSSDEMLEILNIMEDKYNDLIHYFKHIEFEKDVTITREDLLNATRQNINILNAMQKMVETSRVKLNEKALNEFEEQINKINEINE